MRRYVPDFIVKTAECFYLIETKGKAWDQLPEVEQRDNAAKAWGANASEICELPWGYRKVKEDVFDKSQGSWFGNLMGTREEFMCEGRPTGAAGSAPTSGRTEGPSVNSGQARI